MKTACGFCQHQKRGAGTHGPISNREIFTNTELIIQNCFSSQGLHWISLAIALVIFGTGLNVFSDIALTYLIDSYRDVSQSQLHSTCIIVVFIFSFFFLFSKHLSTLLTFPVL